MSFFLLLTRSRSLNPERKEKRRCGSTKDFGCKGHWLEVTLECSSILMVLLQAWHWLDTGIHDPISDLGRFIIIRKQIREKSIECNIDNHFLSVCYLQIYHLYECPFFLKWGLQPFSLWLPLPSMQYPKLSFISRVSWWLAQDGILSQILFIIFPSPPQWDHEYAKLDHFPILHLFIVQLILS